MADRFARAEKRLLGAIAVGGTSGAIFGSWLAVTLTEPLGAAAMLLIAVGFPIAVTGSAWGVALLRPERGRPRLIRLI